MLSLVHGNSENKIKDLCHYGFKQDIFLKKNYLNYIGFGGYGNQVRDIIHIDDVCEIILKQIRNFSKIYNQTFNIGGGSRNSLSLKN